jgi:hypothetical protein
LAATSIATTPLAGLLVELLATDVLDETLSLAELLEAPHQALDRLSTT